MRRFIDDIRSDIAANQVLISNTIYNNNTKDISGSDIQAPLLAIGDLMVDMCDSTIQDEGNIYGNTEVEDVSLNGDWLSLDAGFFTSGDGDDGEFLNVDVANGTITSTSTAGYSYLVLASVTMQAGGQELVEFAIGLDGAPVGFIRQIEGDGTNDGVSGYLRYFSRTTPANGVWTIMARAEDGSATIDIPRIELDVVILPTNNP